MIRDVINRIKEVFGIVNDSKNSYISSKKWRKRENFRYKRQRYLDNEI